MRKVLTSGTLITVAGEGHPRFAGDGGVATAASLNTPTTLGLDSVGNLYVGDFRNHRIRRVDTAGTITTVAGAWPMDDYAPPPCCGSSDTAPATQVKTLNPSSFAVAPDGTLYISYDDGVGRVASDGVLRLWVARQWTTPEVALQSPVAVEDLSIGYANVVVAADGTVFLNTQVQLLAVSGGTARRISDSVPSPYIASDPATGDVVAVSSAAILRQKLSGDRVTLWSAPAGPRTSTTPATATDGPLSMPNAVAVGPDGTRYIIDGAAILAVDPSGQIRPFAGPFTAANAGDNSPALASQLWGPQWLAVDSEGVVYFAEPMMQRIRKIGTDGIVRTAYSTPGNALSVRVDGQGRVYTLVGGNMAGVIRFESDGTRTVMFRDSAATPFYWPGLQYPDSAPGMAVTSDGTVYVGITGTFSNTNSSVLKITPDLKVHSIPMQEYLRPRAVAVDSNGNLYVASISVIKKVLADGSMVTVHGGDGLGFQGEYGFDSAPVPGNQIHDLAIDSAGGLLVVDSALRLIAPSCAPSPGPAITGMSETASSNTALKLAPGQLFSIYGFRLGPDTGVSAAPDKTGHYPAQLSGTQVFVNGEPAPVLFAGASQVNAIVPFDLDEQTTARVVVARGGLSSDVYQKQIGHTGPALFSTQANASDSYVVMVNEDGSINGPEHPAKLGSLVMLFASGLGVTAPAGEDGNVAGPNLKLPVLTATVSIDGQSAEMLYEGTAPNIVEGFMQINVRLPKTISVAGCCSRIGVGLNESAPQPNRLLFFFTE